MDNIESVISDTKIFVSGCGIKFNYSFVPAIISELYVKYFDATQEVLRLNKEIKTSLLKDKDEKQKLKKQYIEKSIETKNLLDNMLTLILSKNTQDWKADDLIKFVYENMNLIDINKLIISAVSPTAEEKKR